MPYDNIIIKSGVTVTVAQDKALDTWQSLTVESGGRLEGPGKLIFRNGAKCEGLTLHYLNARDQATPLPFEFSKLWEIFSMPALWVEWQNNCWVIKDRLPPEYDTSASQGVDGRAEAMAQNLKGLGLAAGTGTKADGSTNFELDRAPNRLEALVMLIRLLGKAEEAKAYTGACPFTDVPDWGKCYVAYAYDNGLTSGSSATQFDMGAASDAMYLTFVLRALGYSDAAGDFAWNAPYDLAGSSGIYPHFVNRGGFLRADMFIISYAALYANLKNGSGTLADKLQTEGVFSAEDFTRIMRHDLLE